ncbi:hypothetical protein [Rhodovibrio sodomensis]|uniref:hypothetical protein n=1 Tax=Rhodovibrio sodomensis TaxID=1088 RepID=UPI0019073847|nr:hypothetical protein [Rhodovibrio sodomensis]
MTDTDTDLAAALWRHARERTPSFGRGHVQTWCNRHAALLQQVCDRGFSWAEIADFLTSVGLTLDNGGAISAETARKLVRRAGVPSSRQRDKSARSVSCYQLQMLPPTPSALGAVSDAVAIISQPKSAGFCAGVKFQPGNNEANDLAPEASTPAPVQRGQQGPPVSRTRGTDQAAETPQSASEKPIDRTSEHDIETVAVPPTARTRDRRRVGSGVGSAGRHDVAELVKKRSERADEGG